MSITVVCYLTFQNEKKSQLKMSKTLTEIAHQLKNANRKVQLIYAFNGTGKTRLCLEVGHTLRDRFPHGVFFVDLAPITDPALVASTIAHTMGIREGGGRPAFDNLREYLADKRVLLLLDNLEQ